MEKINDIVGYESIKMELKRYADVFNNTEKYKKLGVKMPKGLLIFGDSGVGKTYMANTLINEIARDCLVVRKNCTNDNFIIQLEKVFKEAKKCAPSVILLDDLDKFSNADENNPNTDEFVVIQSFIDELKFDDVFVIATATELNKLPDSLLRVDRFDKIIEVKSPKGEDSENIVKHCLSKVRKSKNVKINEIVKVLKGAPFNIVIEIINEAVIYAGFENRTEIETEDLLKAFVRVVYKSPETATNQNEEKLMATAIHEAGHCVVSEMLKPNSITLVSIANTDGDIGGVTSYDDDVEFFDNIESVKDRVKCLLGGKAATEVMTGTIDIGTDSDLNRAFELVSKIAGDCCGSGFDKFLGRYSSDNLKERRDLEISAVMDELYAETKSLLVKNKVFLNKIIEQLKAKKILLADDVQELKKSSVKSKKKQ